MTVAVVGAGFAGLSAAYELRRRGCEVVVLEARDRVGGRVHSRTLANGAVVELGAEFILPGNTYVRELSQRLGLGLWDKGVRYGRRQARGGLRVSEPELKHAVAAIAAALAVDPEAGRNSARALLVALPIAAGAREYILARTEVSAAAAAETVPASNLLGVAHIGDDPSPGIAGGNQGLAAELARGLGPRLRRGEPVRRIVTGHEGVRVGTDRGGVTAEAAIVAVPVPALAAIEFEPPLPDAHARALAAIRYGEAAKLFVPLASPPEPSAVMSVPARYWAWTATAEGDRPQPVVSCFAGSAPALARLEVGSGPEVWLRSLAALRPDLDLDESSGVVLSTWSDDPWSGGAYSVSPDEGVTAALARPAGSILFAGEHTAGALSGLMEGALRSGRDAARLLLGMNRFAPGGHQTN